MVGIKNSVQNSSEICVSCAILTFIQKQSIHSFKNGLNNVTNQVVMMLMQSNKSNISQHSDWPKVFSPLYAMQRNPSSSLCSSYTWPMLALKPTVGYCVYLLSHSDIPIRHRGIQTVRFYQWPIVHDTGAPTTHDKPGSLTCPMYSTDTQEHFSWEEQDLVHISFLVIFSWCEGGSNSQSLGRQSSVLPMTHACTETNTNTDSH